MEGLVNLWWTFYLANIKIPLSFNRQSIESVHPSGISNRLTLSWHGRGEVPYGSSWQKSNPKSDRMTSHFFHAKMMSGSHWCRRGEHFILPLAAAVYSSSSSNGMTSDVYHAKTISGGHWCERGKHWLFQTTWILMFAEWLSITDLLDLRWIGLQIILKITFVSSHFRLKINIAWQSKLSVIYSSFYFFFFLIIIFFRDIYLHLVV